MLPKRINAFDLDHTLLKVNSSFRFGLYLCQQKHISFKSLLFIHLSHLRYSLGLLSLPNLHKQAFEFLFRGRPLPLIEKWVAEFLDAHFEQLIHAPVFDIMKKAQDAGEVVVILSSSPSFLVEPISKRLGVSFWQATQYAVDKDQCFCDIARLILGDDKAKFIADFLKQNKLSRQHVIAYSDSYVDLPFLLSAGTSVGVCPDRKLRAFCINNNWPVI